MNSLKFIMKLESKIKSDFKLTQHRSNQTLNSSIIIRYNEQKRSCHRRLGSHSDVMLYIWKSE